MTWIRNRPLGLVYRDAEKSEGGYTLYCAVSSRHADLLDEAGRIVHQWHHPEGVVHLKLLPSGNLLCHTLPADDAEGSQQIGGSAGALVELDQDSNVVWEYRDAYMHHDYQRLPDGNTLVLRWAKMPFDVAAQVRGGLTAPKDPEWMWGDVVREIDPNGEIVREWRSWEHLNPAHHVKCPLESRKEWTHANSLELTPTGDWLLSFRLTDTIVRVDGKTGDVRWRWGADVLSHQHHAQWLDNDHVLVFDNGCHRKDHPAFSSIVEVDPAENKIVWNYRATPILAFYSFMVSGVQRLAGGNTVITEGATGRIFEITPEGETVWEFVSPWLLESPWGPSNAVFRSYRIPAGDPRLDGLRLSPRPFAETNKRIGANQPLGADDEPGAATTTTTATKKKAPTKKTPAKKTPAKKAAGKKTRGR